MSEIGKELVWFMNQLSPQSESLLLALSDGQVGRVVKAVFRYLDSGREPRLDSASLVVFEAVRRDMEGGLK